MLGPVLATTGTRAIVVGTTAGAQGSSLQPIPAVAATVEGVGEALIDCAGLDPAHLTTVLDPASPKALSDVLMAVARDATDTLVMYFVCHGLIGPDHALYLATRSTRDLTQGFPAYQALPYASLRDVVEHGRARAVLVVLDCCFSGRARGVTQHAMDTLSAAAQQTGFIS